MNENLNRLLYFVAIVDAGTITAAAENLRVSKAVVSKQLQMLEQDLGATLLVRSSRQMHLTDIGKDFYDGAKASVAQAQETYRLVRQRDDKLTGKLRVSAPVDFGNFFVAPFAASFSIEHPEVAIELLFSDNRLNPIEEKFDIAYRAGWPEDSSNVAKKLVDFRLVTVASPKLLERCGHPEDLEDLTRLPFISHAIMRRSDKWSYTDTVSNAKQVISFQQTISADTKQAVKAILLAGAGIAIMPEFIIQPEIASGTLVTLVPQCTVESGGIYSVFPPVPYRSNATKAFSKGFSDYFNRNQHPD